MRSLKSEFILCRAVLSSLLESMVVISTVYIFLTHNHTDITVEVHKRKMNEAISNSVKVRPLKLHLINMSPFLGSL